MTQENPSVDPGYSGYVTSNRISKAAFILGVLSLVCTFATGLPALICGMIGLSRSRDLNGVGYRGSMVGVVLGIISLVITGPAVIIGLFFPAVKAVIQAKSGAKDTMSARQISLGYHNNIDAQSAPAPIWMERPQQPSAFNAPRHASLSWRVPILPFIEQDNVYRNLRLHEPWDSPHNTSVTQFPVQCYTSAADSKGETQTRWRGFTGSGAVFDDLSHAAFRSITDGTSNTLLYTDAPELSPWPKANDVRYSPQGPLPGFGHPNRTFVLVALADGSVRVVHKPAASDFLWRALIVKNDGQIPTADW